MKRCIATTSLIATLLSAQAVSALPPLDENVQEVLQNTVSEVQDATFEARQEALIKVLDEAETILAEVEQQLQNSTYASTETKTDAQALIDGAQAELANLQQQAEQATTSEDLAAVRQDAIAWLQENKELAKEVAIDIYLDSLQAAVTADQEAIQGVKALIPFFTLYKLDTTTLEELISTAETSTAQAQTDVDTAETQRTSTALETATRSTAQATEDVARMVEEAYNLSEQMS